MKSRSVSLIAIFAGLMMIGSGCSTVVDDDDASFDDDTAETSSELKRDKDKDKGKGKDKDKGKKGVKLSVAGTFKTNGSIEITAFDECSNRLFSVNSVVNQIEVVDISNPRKPKGITTIPIDDGIPNSVAIHDGLLAVAVQALERTDPGHVRFYDTKTLRLLQKVGVGAVPDNVVFTPNGKRLLVANEGEPADDYVFDPEGSVSIIDVTRPRGHFTAKTARFLPSTPMKNADSIRIFGPGSTPAQDFEPEYIAISDDSKTAWVTLQENNAIGIIDIEKAKVEAVVGLGFKDHSKPGNGLDASDRDGVLANIKTWPIFGMYQPDTIHHYKVKGKDYLVTVNEGDAREWGSYAEEARIKDLVAAGKIDPSHPIITQGLGTDDKLGRLTVTSVTGDTDGDGDLDRIYAYGARSFSIWNANGSQVFDSGDDLERRLATLVPGMANADQTPDPAPDSRSDNKGPEPEALALGELKGRTYAFVGLERIGGIMVYDIEDPKKPSFVTYFNNRNFSDPANPGDLGPEGLLFIPAKDSPNHKPLLVVSNEISGTLTILNIDD